MTIQTDLLGTFVEGIVANTSFFRDPGFDLREGQLIRGIVRCESTMLGIQVYFMRHGDAGGWRRPWSETRTGRPIVWCCHDLVTVMARPITDWGEQRGSITYEIEKILSSGIEILPPSSAAEREWLESGGNVE